MNWNKAKTVLIIFFICTNLFLLATIFMSANGTTIITDDIIDSTISILKNNRIDIDPQIIPRRTQAVSLIEAKNYIESYDYFSKKIAGENAKMTENNMYVGDNGTIVFNGDKFEFTAIAPLHSEITKKLNSTNVQQIAMNVLKMYDFNDSDLSFAVTEQNSEYTLTLTKQKNSMHCFNSYLTLVLDRSGVKSISGSWLYEGRSTKEKYALKSVTGVLIDYISVANRPTTDEKIVDIELGYSVSEEGIYHSETMLIPSWKITLDDGTSYVLNAADNQSDE